jgi:hypothetical protein
MGFQKVPHCENVRGPCSDCLEKPQTKTQKKETKETAEEELAESDVS